MSDYTSVLVGNVSAEATEETLSGFFGFCGEIKSIELRNDTHEAVIAFGTHEAAETACMLTDTPVLDQSITVAPLPQGDKSDSTESPKEEVKEDDKKEETVEETKEEIKEQQEEKEEEKEQDQEQKDEAKEKTIEPKQDDGNDTTTVTINKDDEKSENVENSSEEPKEVPPESNESNGDDDDDDDDEISVKEDVLHVKMI